MLLTLTSATRAHEITYFKTTFLVKHHFGYWFHVGKPTETAKRDRPRPPIKFLYFTENTSVCVCHHINVYLERSAVWRGENVQLLLSFVAPHKPLKSCTISR